MIDFSSKKSNINKMNLIIKRLLVLCLLLPLVNIKANEFDETKKTIEIRKTAMQGFG